MDAGLNRVPSIVPESDESELIGEAQRGSTAAFEELVRRYDVSVLRLALRLLKSEQEARDIYQEAFLRIYRSLSDFRNECAFRTWVYRIVTNLCLDHLRRATTDPDGASRRAGAGRQTGVPTAILIDERPDSDPERVLERSEMRHRIDAALRSLSPRERLVFELRHYEGLRLKAIGDILETSEETARNCLYRAHRQMRAALGDLGGASRQAAAASPAHANGVDR
jgi:RNA polymerase sigma-70 factor, ECF subfamily